MSHGMHTSRGQLDYLHAREASGWVQALRDPSLEQRAQFVAWLKKSPQHVDDILFMLALDEALGSIDSQRLLDIECLLSEARGQVVAFPVRPARGAALGECAGGAMDAGDGEDAPPGTRRGSRRSLWLRGGVAAGITVASLAGWAMLAQKGAGWRELRTGIGEQRSFELQDGSVMQLNARSHVAFRFSNRSRDVRLFEGEASFRVRHDEKRPFRVTAGDAVIQDIGTQFNVYERSDSTVIAVIDGRVTVTPGENKAPPPVGSSSRPATLSLGANQEARLDHAGAVAVRTVANVTDAVAWQQRRLVFHQETLARVVEEFNRYNLQQIRLEGAAAMSRLYTGVFDADDLDSLALVLARDEDLTVEKTTDGFVVRSRLAAAAPR